MRRREAGFTIMEIMVAIAILAMVSTLIWTAFAQTSRAKKVVETTNDRYHQIRIAMRRICSDLSQAYLSRNMNPQLITRESVFIGQNDDPDSLDMMTFSHRRRYKNARESEQCEVGYYVVEDAENPDQMNLVRREARRVDDEPEEGGITLVLIEDVLEFDLEYFDAPMDEWQDEWDTTQVTGEANRLPMQVRIRIVIRGRNDEELEFVTQTAVRMTEPVFYTGA
ncbi:MAG: prepilin-type N-terminal cleavage/methylation domain-containing protein [Deltaproteobacteria bacterium]|nr:prepilin-type N-terminal cleavage/methylation domain-containing protein [Deltaproteobacteria bacterium]